MPLLLPRPKPQSLASQSVSFLGPSAPERGCLQYVMHETHGIEFDAGTLPQRISNLLCGRPFKTAQAPYDDDDTAHGNGAHAAQKAKGAHGTLHTPGGNIV